MTTPKTRNYDPMIDTWVSIRNVDDLIVSKPFAIIKKRGTVEAIKKQIKAEYGQCYIAIVQDATGYHDVFDIK